MIGDKQKKYSGKGFTHAPEYPRRGPLVQGFTLVEVLVSLAIFSLIATVAADFAVSFYRTQRKTERISDLAGLGRSLMEQIASAARDNKIDYSAFEHPQGLTSPESALYLRGAQDEQLIFKKEDENCPAENAPCLLISRGAQTPLQTSYLTPKDTQLKDLRFYITPARDPFDFDPNSKSYLANAQPYVLIVLSLEKTQIAPGASAPESITLQTGISSRFYQR